jgi:hypothetical protein
MASLSGTVDITVKLKPSGAHILCSVVSSSLSFPMVLHVETDIEEAAMLFCASFSKGSLVHYHHIFKSIKLNVSQKDPAAIAFTGDNAQFMTPLSRAVVKVYGVCQDGDVFITLARDPAENKLVGIALWSLPGTPSKEA